MIFQDETWEENIKSMARTVKFTVTTEGVTYSPTDKIISVVIDKVASNSKLFGYTITRKATIELIDSNNDLHFSKGSEVVITVTEPVAEANFYPSFYIDEIIKDDTGKRITITAYDALAYNGSKSITELNISYPINLTQVQTKIKDYLNIAGVATASTITASYTQEAPINATNENSILQLVNALAEATGTIAFINENNILQFWLPPEDDEYIVDKSQYFNLVLGEPIELSGVIKSNELGDNIIYGDKDNYYQTIKNNMFLDNLDDTVSVGILQQIYSQWNGTVFTPITLEYRGNPAFSTAQVIWVDTIKNGIVKTICGAETLTYNGGLKSSSEWMPEEPEEEEEWVNSASGIVNSMVRASAKIDKVNGRIDLEVGAVETRTNQQLEQITTNYTSQIEQTAQGINSTVSALSDKVDLADRTIEAAQGQIQELNNSFTSLSQTATAIQGTISSLQTSIDGKETITNTTATLDTNGLTVGKSDSSTKTIISDNGMVVNYNNKDMLIANNQGVIAKDLTAKNYLIIDGLIRFQKYGTNRVGCYWIGG